MEGWLAPLAKHTQQQSQEMAQLRDSMSQSLTAYQKLITLLEEAAARDDAMYENLAQHKIALSQKAKRPKGKGKQ